MNPSHPPLRTLLFPSSFHALSQVATQPPAPRYVLADTSTRLVFGVTPVHCPGKASRNSVSFLTHAHSLAGRNARAAHELSRPGSGSMSCSSCCWLVGSGMTHLRETSGKTTAVLVGVRSPALGGLDDDDWLGQHSTHRKVRVLPSFSFSVGWSVGRWYIGAATRAEESRVKFNVLILRAFFYCAYINCWEPLGFDGRGRWSIRRVRVAGLS